VTQLLVLLLPLLVLHGGGGDLLDAVATDAYWKLKGLAPDAPTLLAMAEPPATADVAPLLRDLAADDFATRDAVARQIAALGPAALPQLRAATRHADPEVANSARRLVEQVMAAARTAAVRRLMAIRTLGEMRARDALPLLRRLHDAPEPFVAEYADRALARIEGRAPASRPAADFRADIDLLPARCGIVGQLSLHGDAPVRINAATAGMKLLGKNDPAELLDRLNGDLVAIAEQYGNVRPEAITVALSDDFNGIGGFGVLLVRGRFDRPAIEQALAAAKVEVAEVDHVRVHKLANEARLFFLSADVVAIVGGTGDAALQPLLDLTATARTGRGKLADDRDMAALIATVDRSRAGWAAIRVNDNFRANSFLKPFDHVTATIMRRPGGGLDVAGRAAGQDPQAIAKTVDAHNVTVETLVGQIKQFAGGNAGGNFGAIPVQPVLDLVESARVKATGAAAAADLVFKSELAATIAGIYAMVYPVSPPQQP